MRNEIKEILEELTLTNSTSAIADVKEGYSFEHRVGILEALAKLEAYINSHYIAKDKVRGLKMGEIENEDKRECCDIHKVSYYHVRGFNQAVSEINNAIDLLLDK